MKGKKLMAVCVGALLAFASCGGSKSQNSEAKAEAAPDVLVAYFSATGTTRAAAGLKGKTVIPFMTSGGSNILNSEKELGEAYPGIKWKKGLLMNNVSDEEVKAWIDGELKNW